jgi:hypothetical protein
MLHVYLSITPLGSPRFSFSSHNRKLSFCCKTLGIAVVLRVISSLAQSRRAAPQAPTTRAQRDDEAAQDGKCVEVSAMCGFGSLARCNYSKILVFYMAPQLDPQVLYNGSEKRFRARVIPARCV